MKHGYITLFMGSPETSPVTILRETPRQYVVRHEADWSNRDKGEVRRIDKRHVRVIDGDAT